MVQNVPEPAELEAEAPGSQLHCICYLTYPIYMTTSYFALSLVVLEFSIDSLVQHKTSNEEMFKNMAPETEI